MTAIRGRLHRQSLGFALVLGAASIAGQASSQTLGGDRPVGVRERPRPAYDPLGLQAGAFTVYPRVDLSVAQDSNVFATPGSRLSDVIYRVGGNVDVRSGWSNHGLDLSAQIARLKYERFEEESSTAWAIGASGRLDVRRDTELSLRLRRTHIAELRTETVYFTRPQSPIELDQSTIAASARTTFNRLRLSAGLDWTSLDYQDASDFSGQPLDQDFRNHRRTSATLRAGYAVSPGTAFFAQARFSELDFQPDALGRQRDSVGQSYRIGVSTELTRLISGEASLGVLVQDYDDPTFRDLEGLDFGVNLRWYATPLVTVNLSGERSVRDSAVAAEGGLLTTAMSVGADYELFRNLILSADLRWQTDDFETTDRSFRRQSAAFTADYLLNRTASVRAAIRSQHQTSAGLGPSSDYDDRVISLGLVLNR